MNSGALAPRPEMDELIPTSNAGAIKLERNAVHDTLLYHFPMSPGFRALCSATSVPFVNGDSLRHIRMAVLANAPAS